ncbi:MAG: UDP-N-acetylmuramoyl-L-alanyl-D-glutamate--2,6-diaminopimelate ligase [Propionibacteriaceae bacterium]|nr:UDP-N-acetylmuramoyl-L-alanyl-D-glutamate--2,6-diaminopimelate ligase [Propionibacteriaceae bacterium]
MSGYTGISLDSRKVEPGWLYVALPGTRTHGANFAGQALAAGAAAILTDAAGKQIIGDVPVPVEVADDVRAAMAAAAAEIFGHPSTRLLMLGVTGTTGKTSTVALLAAGLAAAGHRPATMGTLGATLDGRPFRLERTTITTPESPDVQRGLAALLDRGADSVAMEVSSHALVLRRVDEVEFAVSGFTNLGSDHLDFHGTREAYYQAKKLLFTGGRSRKAVLSVDDPAGERLARELAGALPLATVSMVGESDYRAQSAPTPEGTWVSLLTPGGDYEFTLDMPGEFSVRNALLAAAMLDQAGVPLAEALPGFATVSAPGRMQQVKLGGGAPKVLVDFAHSPEAVAAALQALEGRRIAVLGAGGDRDPSKRADMGQAAAANAEVVIVTDDNPRSEDPAAIRAEVLAGAFQAARYSGAEVLDGQDRRGAIALALSKARPGDWVAVLGKGHETGQEIGQEVLPFDDAQVVRELWEAGHG